MKNKYYNTKESVEEYIELAKDVNGRLLIEKFNLALPSHSSVLEIGSGPGTDWKILNEYYNTTGSDYSTEFLNHLTSSNPAGKFLELDAITLKTELKFNGIFSNKVMHHLKDEELEISIKRQYQLLKTNGIICHSFWKGDGSETFKGMFVNYYDENKLNTVFEEHFEILLLENYNEFEDADSLLLIGKKR